MSRSKPRYLQIYDEISLMIRNQEVLPGDLLPTEAELCRKYDASRPTVAKALNLLAKEKLVFRRAGFGTQVNLPGRSSLTAGLLIPRLHGTEIFEPICASLTKTAGMEAMRIIRPSDLSMESSMESKKVSKLLTDPFIEERVKGVFFAPVEHVSCAQDLNLQIINRLHTHGIQVVLLDRDVYPWPRQTQCDLVGIDNIEAGYTMCGHLIGNGCQNLAFVSAPDSAMTIKLRFIGIREALIHNGRSGRELQEIEFNPEEAERTAKTLLEKGIDGVICANDVTAAALLRALIDLGADIPGSMQVCGFDDVKYASLLTVPLTSYHQPCEDIGKVAALTMLNRIRHPDSPIHRVTLKGKIIVRASAQGPIRIQSQ